MTYFSSVGKHHNNHQQRPILLLAAVSLALFGLTVVDYPIANPIFAQQQDDNGNDSRTILWVDVKDFISSGTAEDISTALQSTSPAAASSSHTPFSAVILALDTPGGSLDATFDIIDSIQQSPVPVIGYVYPQGKSAWSAGTIILLATDYATMAPVTTIGSAQPVQGTEPVNDTKVRNVIEAMAANPQELLAVADGANVTTLNGQKILQTANAEIITHESSLRTQLVNFLSNPLIATTLMTIGFFALIYGIMSPGFGVEIAGAVFIILGLLGQGLDINWGAFALLGLGIGLVAYELYSPGFGAVGIGGIAVAAVGIVFMITQPVRPLLVTEEHLGNLAALSIITIAPFAGLMALITYKVWKIKKREPKQFVVQSEEGVALDSISANRIGFVIVGGEYWKAKSSSGDEEINKGDKIKVVGKESDLLIVE